MSLFTYFKKKQGSTANSIEKKSEDSNNGLLEDSKKCESPVDNKPFIFVDSISIQRDRQDQQTDFPPTNGLCSFAFDSISIGEVQAPPPQELSYQEDILSKLKESVQSQMNSIELSNMFEVCPDCSKGRLKLFSAGTTNFVCDEGCKVPLTDSLVTYQVSKKMMALHEVIKQSEREAGQCRVKLSVGLERITQTKKSADKARNKYIEILDSLLKHIIAKATEQLAEKEKLVDSYFSDLTFLRTTTTQIMNTYSSVISSLTTLELSLKDLGAPLSTITLPTPNPMNITILKYDSTIIQKGLETISKTQYNLECAEELFRLELINSPPEGFSSSPKVYLMDMMAKLLPLLTEGLTMPNIISPKQQAPASTFLQ